MAKLPDPYAMGPSPQRERRPAARIDATALAEGGESFGRAVGRGGEAIARAASGEAALGQAEFQAGAELARSTERVGDYAGRNLRKAAEAEGGAVISGGDAMSNAIRRGAEMEQRGFAQLGEGMTQFAKGAQDYVDADLRLDVPRAKANFISGKTIRDAEADLDTDRATLRERYDKDITGLRASSAEMIRHPRLREQFLLETQDDVARGQVRVDRHVFKLDSGERLGEMQQQLDNLDKAARIRKEEDRGEIIDEGRKLIDARQQAGDLTPLEAFNAKRDWVQRYAVATYEGMPPERRVKELNRGPLGMDEYAERTVGVESGGKATARNLRSSATGAGQFIDSTWLEVLKNGGPKEIADQIEFDGKKYSVSDPAARAAILDLRKDERLSRNMVVVYGQMNAGVLAKRGIDPSYSNLYLAHLLGPETAANVISADPNTPISDLVGAKAIRDNREILSGKTAGTVTDWAGLKMGTSGGTGKLIDFIPEDKLRTMRNGANAELALIEKRKEDLADKERKQLGEDLLKEAYSRSYKSELTADFIEQVRPHITPAQYEGLLKTLGPDAATDDTDAIADLTQKIDATDPSEFQKQAVGYLKQNKLKTSTYISLSEKNRTASKDDAPASPYKAGRDLVKTTLDPGQLLSGPAAAVARSAQSQAMTEFDNWVQANPRSSRADTVQEAQNIIQRYQVIPFDQMKLAVGTSRYFGQKSREAVTTADIDTAEQQLADDITSKRLTPAQQEFEVRMLNNWRGILDREQAIRDKQRPKPK